jgi:flagellar biosynthesis/type III secretory pathway protein FliH
MSRRFIPPTVGGILRDGPRSEEAFDLARVREEAYAEGLRVGRHEGHAIGLRQGEERAAEIYQVELQRLCAEYAKQHGIEVVLAALRDLLAAHEQTRREVEDEARAAISSALRVLFPVLLAQTAGQEIAGLIGDALCERGIEALTVRADPETIASIRDQGLTEADTLTLLPDPAMKPGTAVATWSAGGLSFDPAALLEQVAGILHPQSQLEEAACK